MNGHPHQGEERNHNKASTHTQQTGEKACCAPYYQTFSKQQKHGQPRLTLREIATTLGMREPKADEATSNVAPASQVEHAADGFDTR